MRKRKTMKKALPVALAVLLLLSMFALGASAESLEDYGFCPCINGREIMSLTHNDPAEFTCPVCNTMYSCEYVYNSDGPFIKELSDGDYYCYSVFEEEEEEEEVYCIATLYDEDGNEITSRRLYLTSVNIITPEPDSPIDTDSPPDNMVGSMVTTVTAGLGGIFVGIGSSIVTFFDNTVLDADGNLSTFAIWALAFLGIAFALGVVKFITFLVKRK